MITKRLEETLHRTLNYAHERTHEFATLEHLLLALTDDPDAIDVFQGCNVDLSRLRREVASYLDNELATIKGADDPNRLHRFSAYYNALQFMSKLRVLGR